MDLQWDRVAGEDGGALAGPAGAVRELGACCVTTVYSRFRQWQRAGVWKRVLAALQAEGDVAGRLDWTLHFVDGTVVRAHQHAAGSARRSMSASSASSTA